MDRISYVTYHRSEEAEEKIKDRSVLFIDNEVAMQVLGMEDCLKEMEDAYREMGLEGVTDRRTTFHTLRSDEQQWTSWSPMEAVVRRLGIVGVRIRSNMEVRDEKRHDFYCVTPGKYCGLILLFSTEDATPLAILNDGHIQHMSVGCTGGLSAKYFARQDASTLGILGAAGMGTTHAWSMAKVRNITKIKVYSPNPAHREAFADQMSLDMGIEVVALDDPRQVVQGSDIVACCTNADVPVMFGEWLEPGMHAVAVGVSEFDVDLMRRVDRYVYSRSRSTEHYFTKPKEYDASDKESTAPEIRWARKEGEAEVEGRMSFLPQVVAGQIPGRANATETSCFVSQGMPMQFIVIAHKVYQLAKERGLGRKLPLGWFLQDIHN